MKNFFCFWLLGFGCLFILSFYYPVMAQEVTLEAQVKQILVEKQIVPTGSKQKQWYQKLKLIITDQKESKMVGKTITIENGNLPMSKVLRFKVGDQVLLTKTQLGQKKAVYYISDYVRRPALLWLLLIFLVIVLAISRLQGLTSILGMIFSFLVIFKIILPFILLGDDPVFMALIGAMIIVPVTFFLSHGINKKTFVAIFGTLVGLLITGMLASFFANAAHLTGLASEEANFLQSFLPNIIQIQGLVLAGIIIGALGVLDDITISQAAIVSELAKNQGRKLSRLELYQQAMNIGQDHIASMVNTLILVYAGAALPLLLLFVNNPHSLSEIVNYEFMAEEIIRTLVSSIGLILSVPITTFFAVWWMLK